MENSLIEIEENVLYHKQVSDCIYVNHLDWGALKKDWTFSGHYGRKKKREKMGSHVSSNLVSSVTSNLDFEKSLFIPLSVLFIQGKNLLTCVIRLTESSMYFQWNKMTNFVLTRTGLSIKWQTFGQN